MKALLPLYRMPRLGPGHVLISVPYLNYGGPLGDPRAGAALLDRALEEARSTGARRLEPDGPPELYGFRRRREATMPPHPARRLPPASLPSTAPHSRRGVSLDHRGPRCVYL